MHVETQRVYIPDARQFGAIVTAMPAGYTGHAYRVRLDDGREVLASGSQVASADNVAVFRRMEG